MIVQDHICYIEETFSGSLNVFLDGNRFSHYHFSENDSQEGDKMDEIMELLEMLSTDQLNEFISFLLKLRDSEDNFSLPASCFQEENQTNL